MGESGEQSFFKEFVGQRFSFLQNYSRFIKPDKPLPSWSSSDVNEFIASDPVHGPTVMFFFTLFSLVSVLFGFFLARVYKISQICQFDFNLKLWLYFKLCGSISLLLDEDLVTFLLVWELLFDGVLIFFLVYLFDGNFCFVCGVLFFDSILVFDK